MSPLGFKFLMNHIAKHEKHSLEVDPDFLLNGPYLRFYLSLSLLTWGNPVKLSKKLVKISQKTNHKIHFKMFHEIRMNLQLEKR